MKFIKLSVSTCIGLSINNRPYNFFTWMSDTYGLRISEYIVSDDNKSYLFEVTDNEKATIFFLSNNIK